MEKHSMRHLLWAALFLLYCSCGCLAAVVQQLPQKGESALQAYTVSTAAEQWQPIRIAVYTERVEEIMTYCNEKVMSSKYEPLQDLKNDLEQRFKQLCDGENKMTTKRMHTLFKEVLPEAIKLHRDRLNVKRVENNLILWKEDYEDPYNIFVKYCHQLKMPDEHFKDGIPNADFMLYVDLHPVDRTINDCTKDNKNGDRPTSARITFVPKEIVATRQYIRLAARYIAVGLGFEIFYMGGQNVQYSLLDLNGVQKYIRVLAGNTVKGKMNEHYNSQDYAGMVLHYHETKIFTEWERRIAKDELMSQYTGEPTGMFYTNLTLAVFDTMSFYTANFSMAEPMSWGNQSGRDFITNKCTELIKDPKYNKVFCDEGEDKSVLKCTSDRFGLGVCSKDNTNKHSMSDEYKFFETVGEQSEMIKECPIIKPFQQTMCENGKETLMPGSIVSNMSRCLDVKETVEIDENGKKVKVQGICAKVKCDNGKVHVQYKGDKEKVNGEQKWHECTEEGTINLQGSVFTSGTIVCPKYAEVCTGLPETEPFNISYTEVNVPEDKVEEEETPGEEEEEKPGDETEEQSSSSAESEMNSGTGDQDQTQKPGDNEDGATDNSIALSFFGPLMLPVCIVAAVVAL
ncbi:surface protease GP63 [Trypanosoma theileri]|uniref:Leishmanolysin-like peptidase n=1 Tax=Trypanosoma theileri TaxID=67003 RepID=A0A1X0NW07_9TRYP|nr:surface protease GP63 [Trypanosoma theileri]ORC88886.1 surface protease GP63 [Trypanosoma theileri]